MMFELSLDYILQSEHAKQLIAFSACVVILIIWMKKRVQKLLERRAFRRRQNARSVPSYTDDRAVQLEFDF